MTDSWGFRFAKGMAVEGVTGMAVSAIRLNLAIGTGGMSEVHIQIVTRAYAAYEGYANGGVLGSAVDAYNVGNPLYGMGVAGARLYHAIDSGNVEEIGAAALPVAVAVVGIAGGKLAGSNTAGGFSSFRAFKRAMGPAGEGMQWHHVVEQTWWNVLRFGPKAIHNVKNILPLEIGIHQKVSGLYSSKRQAITGTGAIVRNWLKPQSFKAQTNFGLNAIQNIRQGIW